MPERYHIPYNAGCNSPASLLFVDTETHAQQLVWPKGAREEVLRLWVACSVRMKSGIIDREKWYKGRTADEFWSQAECLIRKKQPLYIICHNSSFDLTTLEFWKQVEDGLLILFKDKKGGKDAGPALTGKCRTLHGCLILDSPPTIVVAKTKRGKLVILDTLNWFRCPLAELGDSIGVPKQHMPAREESDETWEHYCHNDVKIIKNAVCGMIRWLRENDMGNWRYTAASQAFGTYRHKFMCKRIQLHREEKVVKLEREAFAPGETRCFYWGHLRPMRESIPTVGGWQRHDNMPARQGPVYHLDVSSLYPSVMAGNLYPCRLLGHHPFMGEQQLRTTLESFGVIARVKIKTQDVLPYRTNGGDLHWATGEFYTTLCGPDLIPLLDRSHIFTILDTVVYEMGDLFTQFVNYMYPHKEANRKAGYPALSTYYKTLLNSLWGKFAQKQPEWIDAPGVSAPSAWGPFGQFDAETQLIVRYRAIGWHVQREQERGEARYAFPAIAAYVTSYARQRMRSLRTVAGEDNVYYQDCDSLHVNQEGLDRLNNAGQLRHNELGYLRRIDTAETAVYYGVKDYVLGENKICAGVPRTARWLGSREVEFEEWEKIEHLLDRNCANSVQVKPVRKSLQSCHVGGVVAPNGRVRPWTVVEGVLR